MEINKVKRVTIDKTNHSERMKVIKSQMEERRNELKLKQEERMKVIKSQKEEKLNEKQ